MVNIRRLGSVLGGVPLSSVGSRLLVYALDVLAPVGAGQTQG